MLFQKSLQVFGTISEEGWFGVWIDIPATETFANLSKKIIFFYFIFLFLFVSNLYLIYFIFFLLFCILVIIAKHNV